MSFNNPISPGVSAFVAKMRVRAAQPRGAISALQPAARTLAWRVSPANGRLESCRLIEAQADEGLLRSRRRLHG